MKGMKGTKYIISTNGGYRVYKTINGKQEHLGFGKTLINALMIRDWCEHNDWKKYPTIQRTLPKHIYKDKNGFLIKKTINGKSNHLAWDKTLKGVLMKLDWCKSHDWKPYPKNKEDTIK